MIIRVFLFLALSFSYFVSAEQISIMSYNLNNLFDAKDDVGKDDKAYLPIEFKNNDDHIMGCLQVNNSKWRNECLFLDWSEEVVQKKISNISDLLISMGESQPDIIAIQEIENLNVLRMLFSKIEALGYTDFALIEGEDYRGIDNAIISKYPIYGARNFKIRFSDSVEVTSSRPIFEVKLGLDNEIIRVYVVHFPAPYNSANSRIDALNNLYAIVNSHNDKWIALGDFNITSQEEKDLGIYSQLNNDWYVSHLDGCKKCKGTFFYDQDGTWSFLDAIVFPKNKKMSLETSYIFKNEINIDTKDGKPRDFGILTGKGISDHLPVVAEIRIN